MANPIEQLIEYFAKFPGIGPRQAERFVYFLLKQDISFVDKLAETMVSARKHVKVCKESCAVFYTNDPKENLSPIARDKSRDQSLLMIVEKDSDLKNIERSRSYNGTYFVLGGVLQIFDTEPNSKIRSKELMAVVKKRAANESLREIILALSANPDSEHTTGYLKKILEPVATKHAITVTLLGRGLSTGSELEYSDTETIKNALGSRK